MTIAILNLNDDCLQKIFELLEIGDCMSVAETCKRFAGIMYFVFRRRHSSLKSTSVMQDKDFADRMLAHVGIHLKSLSVGSEDKSGDLLTKSTLRENLKKIFLRHCKLNPKTFPCESTSFQHIESLSMIQCDLRLNRDFFTTFSSIENVNFCFCRGIHNKSLTRFFQKNENIKSLTFQCNGFNKFPLGSLALLPKLDRVNFLGLVESAEYLGQLSELKSLTKLKLSTRHLNRNNIGDALVKLNFLEELEVNNFIIEEDVFQALSSFHKLRRLKLTFPRIFSWKWKSTFILPTKITNLQLGGVYISVKQIGSLINQLPKLKQFWMSPRAITLDLNKVEIDNFREIVQLIYDGLNMNDSLRCVYVILVNEKYSAEEIRAGGLRFFAKNPNERCFGIDFPDYEELLIG